ncbi:hypothetical protein BDW22DRAFT_1324401 [Trametopsis cervina]|nr:hypothetical protein BDW22DRAFT_1324401 [Trametopsis cervina]
MTEAARRAEQNEAEAFWAVHYEFLVLNGYLLRPRCHPKWRPSWDLEENRDVDPSTFEDWITSPARHHVMDATRMQDGALVYIKCVEKGALEEKIARMFSRADLAAKPENHCVPITGFIEGDKDKGVDFIVMPFLRPVNKPPFETVDDVIDFVDQILEGLKFIHQQGVAHRDCSVQNLMMDANSLFPEGFHPVSLILDPTATRLAKQKPRSSARVKYYYVDFGISVHILPGQPKLALGGAGRDQSVPELSHVVPYDPFLVDIYIIGNMFKTFLHKVYANVDFLAPLITAMTMEDPSDRPDATEAVRRWHQLKGTISSFRRKSRLRAISEPWLTSFVLGGIDIVGRGGKGLLSWMGDWQG